MKRNVLAIVAVGLIIPAVWADAGEPDLAEQLWATSNMWGVAAERTKYRYSAVPSLLARMRGEERYDATLHDWYCSLLQYDDCLDKDWAWCGAKSELLHMCAHLRSVSVSADAWLRTADYLGSLRVAAAPQTNTVFSSVEEWLAHSQEEQNTFLLRWNSCLAARDAVPRILDVVTNVFPRTVLPRLEEPGRTEIISNVTERARLTEAERAAIQGVSDSLHEMPDNGN